jgi:hypothetical protein
MVLQEKLFDAGKGIKKEMLLIFFAPKDFFPK